MKLTQVEFSNITNAMTPAAFAKLENLLMYHVRVDGDLFEHYRVAVTSAPYSHANEQRLKVALRYMRPAARKQGFNL